MMHKKTLLAVWAGMFVLCAALGFVPEPEGALGAALTALSLLFFVPPLLLLRGGDAHTRLLVRWLSLASLAVSCLLLALSIRLSFAPEWVGQFLHVLLTILATPMICSGRWAMSLFGWACVLMLSLRKPANAP